MVYTKVTIILVKEKDSSVEHGRNDPDEQLRVPKNSSMPKADKSKRGKKRTKGSTSEKAAKKAKRTVVFTDSEVSEVNTIFLIL